MFIPSVSNRKNYFNFGILKETLDYKKFYIMRYGTYSEKRIRLSNLIRREKINETITQSLVKAMIEQKGRMCRGGVSVIGDA